MKYLLYGLLSFSFISLTGCQTTTNSPSLPNNAIAYETQMEFQSGLVHVNVSVNNAEAKPFVLDSGLPEMLLSPEQADLSGTIQSGESIKITGVGDRVVTANVVKNLLVDLGGIQWGAGAAVVLPEALSQIIEQNTGQPFYGVLGAQLFESYVVVIDFQQEKITLKPSKGYQYKGQGEVIPLKFINRKPYIEASLNITKDSLPQKGLFLIDLGSSQGLDIKQIDQDRVSLDLNALPKRFAAGLGGEQQFPMGRIHHLQIGGQTLFDPITTFELKESNNDKSLRGRIGTQILSKYQLIFNYAKQQLILDSPPSSFARMKFDMSGLRLQWDKEERHSIRISHIYPKSPGSQVDLKVGDRILEIDNHPVKDQTLHDIKQKFIGTPGSIRQLLIQRNSETFSRSLTLKHLI